MLDLDQRLEAATRELRDELRPISLAPASTVVRRHHRRRTATVLVSVIAVVGLGATAIAATRTADKPHPASDSTPPSPPTGADSLLFPTEMIDGTPDEVMVGPRYSYGPRGLVRAPDGTLFVISLTERMSTQLTPDADREVIDGRTFAVERFDGELSYTSVDDCTALFVRQSHPTADQFDANAITLLHALNVTGRDVALTLPDGWESFGVGGIGDLVQVAFHSTIGGGRDQFNLMQLPDSKVATLLGLAGAPLQQTTFDGRPAWTASSTLTSVAWQDGDNAAMLYSNTATLDQLIRVARTLRHGQGDQFDDYEWTTGAPGATAPVDTRPLETGAAIEGQPTVNTEGCGTLQMTIVD